MKKEELIKYFYHNHFELITYTNSLSAGQFEFSSDGKWTAGQQLSHILLCLQPIAKAIHSKDFLLEKFGKITRPTLEVDKVIEIYKSALKSGGKAPERFVPGTIRIEDRSALAEEIIKLLESINSGFLTYSEEELDTCVMPHPLLGNLTIREMFYLMAYHGLHHLRMTEQNLESLAMSN